MTGFEAVVDALTTGLSPANLWGELGTVVPMLIIFFLFGLGLYFLRKAIKGGQKGRARL